VIDKRDTRMLMRADGEEGPVKYALADSPDKRMLQA
jgi:hypothetical protein